MSLIKDFKEFALKGNVLDLAVGIIIGAAFGKIVSSLVEDILMPPLGMLTGGIDFSNLAFKIADGTMEPDGKMGPPVEIRYGNFIQIVIQFVIVAFAVFMIVKGFLRLERKKEVEIAAPPAPPELSTQEKLLMEIRDALKK